MEKFKKCVKFHFRYWPHGKILYIKSCRNFSHASNSVHFLQNFTHSVQKIDANYKSLWHKFFRIASQKVLFGDRKD